MDSAVLIDNVVVVVVAVVDTCVSNGLAVDSVVVGWMRSVSPVLTKERSIRNRER